MGRSTDQAQQALMAEDEDWVDFLAGSQAERKTGCHHPRQRICGGCWRGLDVVFAHYSQKVHLVQVSGGWETISRVHQCVVGALVHHRGCACVVISMVVAAMHLSHSLGWAGCRRGYYQTEQT